MRVAKMEGEGVEVGVGAVASLVIVNHYVRFFVLFLFFTAVFFALRKY